jgi:hypothetical protein
MFNKGQLSGLMKQAQMMQENLRKAQDELALIEVSGEAAAGRVKIEMSCKHVVKRVHIDPAVMDDKEMLEDLLTAAFNDAARKVEQTSEEKMGKLSAGLPAGMKLPF